MHQQTHLLTIPKTAILPLMAVFFLAETNVIALKISIKSAAHTDIDPSFNPRSNMALALPQNKLQVYALDRYWYGIEYRVL